MPHVTRINSPRRCNNPKYIRSYPQKVIRNTESRTDKMEDKTLIIALKLRDKFHKIYVRHIHCGL